MKTPYPIPAVLRFTGRLPVRTQINGRHIEGTLGAEIVDPSCWKEPPHKVFANLPRFDIVARGAQTLLDNPQGPMLRRDAAGKLLPELVEAKGMEAFVRKYGVLQGRDSSTDQFDEDAANFTDAQDTLRRAWEGDRHANAEIEMQVKYALEAQPSVRVGGIELTTDNLWSLICILFLLDHAAGKTGVCGNPECPARYFLRKRKDQKYCERGKCSAYAQRSYALGWWERKGYEERRRKARHAKRNRKKAR